VLETLAGVSHEDAMAHPIEGAHSIWELALHLSSDYRLVLRRLNGDGRQLTEEEGWPLPEATQEAWVETVERLRRLNRELRSAVRGFPSERLNDQLVPSVPYTAYAQLIGITQHGLYHAGQIAILKRALQRRDCEAAISRHWRGVSKRERAEAYLAHLQSETVPQLARIPGFVRVSILKREVDRGTEFQIVTVWTSLEAIQAFAGQDVEAAVVPAVVRDMMVEFDERVRHYEVVAAVETAKGT
jgi:heme-degrading monooxygenase HmoA/uncharacterized damage-inducible protein DinB